MHKIAIFLTFLTILFIISAKPFPISANNSFDSQLTNEEFETIQILVESKLNNINYSIELISSLSTTNRYVLVECNNSYLIFDRLFNVYTEYSNFTCSPYHGINSNFIKLYFGPTFYYCAIEGLIIDITSNKVLSDSEIDELMCVEELFSEAYCINKNNQVKTPQNKNRTSKYINSAYYFENLINNMGDSSSSGYSEACAYVAIGMILSYYDSVLNDTVIADTYDVTENEMFSTFGNISTGVYLESPGIDDSFMLLLFNMSYVNNISPLNNYHLDIIQSKQLIETYLNSKNLNYNSYINNNIFGNNTFCENAIDNNCPVFIGIWSSLTIGHAVVGYGYDDDGIFANFGNKNSSTNINLNGYFIVASMYVSLSESHLCSDNYEWTFNNCSGTVCPCGIVNCNHEYELYTQYSSTYHNAYCQACGRSILEAHHFVFYDTYYQCSDCGYINYHIHSFSYTPRGDGRRHIAHCGCGETRLENCYGYVQLGGDAYCMYCGQLLI